MATADLLGYADRWSVRAGERIAFRVSSAAASYRAEIVRLDRGPTTPGEPAAADPLPGFGEEVPGRLQPIVPGSCVVVPRNEAFRWDEGLTVQLWVQPTLPGNEKAQGICTHGWGNA